ncbi:phosphotransferase family protein [Rhodococcus sp. NPDC078407]|uniref:phosphotransferase family protein n=1 Tax=Rhodococcus sp. NPDC078407 TaxID=3364509 RepID=UPI0037CBA76E
MAEQMVDAWRGARTPSPTCVVHGDPSAENAIIDERGRCVLIDWDEARVDQPHYDLPAGPAKPDYAKSLVRDFMRPAPR